MFLVLTVLALSLSLVKSKPAILEEVHPVLCEYNGLTFSPGEGRYLDHVGCKVSIVKCSATGETSVVQKHDCSYEKATQKPMSSPSQVTTTTVHPELGPVCHFEGTFYRPGEIIHQGNNNGLCFGVYCSEEIEVLKFDGVECNATFTEPTTTETPVTAHFLDIGCEIEGVLFEPGEVILREQHKDECWEIYCGDNAPEKREISGVCEDW